MCKIWAVQRAKGERGIPLTVNVPYGYVKDPENPKHWLIVAVHQLDAQGLRHDALHLVLVGRHHQLLQFRQSLIHRRQRCPERFCR